MGRMTPPPESRAPTRIWLTLAEKFVPGTGAQVKGTIEVKTSGDDYEKMRKMEENHPHGRYAQQAGATPFETPQDFQEAKTFQQILAECALVRYARRARVRP
jgi:hypothetical protein